MKKSHLNSQEHENSKENTKIEVSENNAKKKPKIKINKKGFLAIICVILAIPIIILPIATVVIYESIFSYRYETPQWLKFSVDDFEGLTVERSDFDSDGVTLAGYKYEKTGDKKGILIISHGLGGGGQNTYMPIADYFTSNNYYVFSYDARGNDESGGNDVEGLPQGIIDLDNAINHVKATEEYKGLPIMLLGHSWGGYSVGNVLNIHTDIKTAVIIAGCNESEDLLQYQGEAITKMSMGYAMPYLELYERLKFGKKYTDITATEGMANTETKLFIIHSKNDTTVPTIYGYNKFYKEFSASEHSDRFTFVLYEDKGHDYLYYSDDAWEYRATLNENYKNYVESNNKEYSAETKTEFMNANLDKKRCFELNYELFGEILETFNSSVTASK